MKNEEIKRMIPAIPEMMKYVREKRQPINNQTKQLNITATANALVLPEK